MSSHAENKEDMRKDSKLSGTYFIPRPSDHIFKYKETPEQGILKENKNHYIIEKITYERGIEVYYRDCPFPRKGFPTLEAVSAVNVVKKIFIEAIKTFSKWQFILGWPLVLLSRTRPIAHVIKGATGIPSYSSLDRLVASYNRIGYGIVSQFIVKPEYMTPFAGEFQALIYTFMRKLTGTLEISADESRKFAIILGTIFEYDNAYRYRLQDVFSETTKQKLTENPRQEIKRLCKIYLEREKDPDVVKKYRALIKLISLPLYLPMIKSAMRKALHSCEFERLQMDEADKYWCKIRHDYNFQGLPVEERMKDYKPIQAVRIVT